MWLSDHVKAQYAVEVLESAGEPLGLNLSHDKTACVDFSRWKLTSLRLTFANGEVMKQRHTVRYLGVLLDTDPLDGTVRGVTANCGALHAKSCFIQRTRCYLLQKIPKKKSRNPP